MSRKQTIIDIFNEMNFEEIPNDSESKEKTTQGGIQQAEQQKSSDKAPINLNDVIKNSAKAQEIWKTSLVKNRAKILHKIGKILLENEFFSEGAEYFEYYSDLLVIKEEQISQESSHVILVILPKDFPPLIFCSVVAAALASGSSVIIQSECPEAVVFQNAIENSELPKGLYSVVSNPKFFSSESPLYNIYYVILYNEELNDLPLFKVCGNLNFICPHRTSAILLESCDLSAALNKLLMETWGPNSSMWGVSTVIVQESIYKKFIEKLKIQLQSLSVKKKYVVKFNNNLERFNELLQKAQKTGGKIIRQKTNNEWSPTVVLQCQDQNIQSDFLFWKVVTCRTATEGVSLLNNTRYGLGTSVWTEISSQALEVAAELNCLNIWVNCHGCFSADKPLQPINQSGNFVCGGVEGIMQFADVKQIKINSKEKKKEFGKENIKEIDPSLKQFLNSSILSSFTSSQNWKRNNKRKLIIKKISNLLDNKNDHSLSEEINYFCHCETISEYCENFNEKKFFTVQQPIPVGVIALILTNANINATISLITPALVLGNAVIVVLKEQNLELMNVLQIFKDNLPKNLLQVFVGEDSAKFIISDPIIQEFWLRDEANQSEEFIQNIMYLLNLNVKRYWMTPKIIPKSFSLFWRKCLRQKIIWLPNVDKFP